LKNKGEKQMAEESREVQAKELTLEESFARLDELVARMESRDISLEESFQLYKEGMELLKSSREKIDTVEKKMLQISADGEQLPFD
jgi:exodeoxyribonuclease VII small subunit